MANNRSPYCTGLPFSTYALTISPSVLGRNLVHQLHRLDDAEHLVLLHPLPDLDERGRAGLRAPVEGADDRRLHHRQLERFASRPRSGPAPRGADGPRPPVAARRSPAAGAAAIICIGAAWKVGRARLAHPQLQPVAFQLEFRQVVLAHERENPFDIRKVHSAPSSLRAAPCTRRQSTSQPVVGDQHVVFDPHAADARARTRPARS